MSGMHLVRDVFCRCCDEKLGWTYDQASDPNQRYKVGKFVLERAKIRLNLRPSSDELFQLIQISADESQDYESALDRIQPQPYDTDYDE